MPRIFGTRPLGWIMKKMSKLSNKKKSDEAADEALALELQDEELAHELQFHENNLGFSEKFVREFEESLVLQPSSSASTSNSKAPYPGSVAWTEPEADFLRALGIHLPLRILEKECGICFDTLPQYSFVSTPGCTHEYCSGCCQNHAEAKIMSGSSQIKCPEGACVHHYDMEQCHQLLSDSSFDALNVRLTEAAIPAALKLFCPFPDCSACMEKTSATPDVAVEPFAECYACHRGFCQECNVPWHTDQTCGERRASEINDKLSGDSKLRDLAKQKKWQQCPDCNRVIDLLRGCNHMTCLCGLEFCYVCGAKWENKAATCKCSLWDETRIIHH